jgi:hypothetical protein
MFRLMDHDIWAASSFLLMGFLLLEQPFESRPSAPIVFEVRHDAPVKHFVNPLPQVHAQS